MSRDAKVGLAIVFTFACLFGTVLVHRLHRESPAANPTQVSQEGASVNPPTVETGEPTTTTTVDALPTDTMTHPFADARPTPVPTFGTNHLAHQPDMHVQPSIETNAAPPTTGGQITLTEPHSSRMPAAVVDPPAAVSNELLGNNVPAQVHHLEQNVPDEQMTQPDVATKLQMQPAPPAGQLLDDYRPGEVTSVPQNEVEKSSRSSLVLESVPPRMPVDGDVASDIEPIHQAAGRSSEDSNYTDAQPIIEPVTERTDVPVQPFRNREQPFVDNANKHVPNVESGLVQELAERPALPNAPAMRSSELGMTDAAPEVGEERTHTVQSGDSFWSISARYYRTGKYFRELERYNAQRQTGGTRGTTRKHLVPGMTVYLPDESVLRQRSSGPARSRTAPSNSAESELAVDSAAPPGTYRVQDGESLSTIAERVLGSSKRWEEIYHLNRDKLDDPHQVRAGMQLKVPSQRETEKMADRP